MKMYKLLKKLYLHIFWGSLENVLLLFTVIFLLLNYFLFFFRKNYLIIFLICIGVGGVQTGSTRHVGHLLAYCTCPG
jgi:hypothetical protein